MAAESLTSEYPNPSEAPLQTGLSRRWRLSTASDQAGELRLLTADLAGVLMAKRREDGVFYRWSASQVWTSHLVPWLGLAKVGGSR